MQAQCPQCSTRIQIDDSKVPDRPFKVRCPKCQHVVALPGRGAEAPGPASPSAEASRRPGDGRRPGPRPLHRRRHRRLRRRCDAEHDGLEGRERRPRRAARRRPRHGDHHLPGQPGLQRGRGRRRRGGGSPARAGRLRGRGHRARPRPSPGSPRPSPSASSGFPRTRAGASSSFWSARSSRTADGTQAWATQADLVLSPHDAGRCENVIRSTLAERKRLYQPFVDARRKIESD